MLEKTRNWKKTAQCRLETASENGVHICWYSTAEWSGGIKFTYFAAKARTAMYAAEVPRERRLDFFPEVITTMTKLDWLNLITINCIKKTRIEHYGLPIVPVLTSHTYMGRSGNHQNRERWENRGPRNHVYFCRLCLQSQGWLLQDVEPQNQDGFRDTWCGIS